RNWRARIAAVDALLDDAERTERPVVLLTTAPGPSGEPPPELSLQRATDVRATVRALAPKPWAVDRAAAARRLDALTLDSPASVRWIAEGVEGQDVATLARRLQRFGRLEV